MNAVAKLITGHGRRRPRHRRHARWTVSATGLPELIANTGLIAPELITGKVHRCHVPLLTITKFDIRELTLIVGGRPTELIPQFVIIPSTFGVLHWAFFFLKLNSDEGTNMMYGEKKNHYIDLHCMFGKEFFFLPIGCSREDMDINVAWGNPRAVPFYLTGWKV